MKQKLLLNWIWDWIWLRVRVWFRVRGFFSNCDAYQFFHDFHLVIHFFYCLQHRICFKRNMYFGPRVFRVLVFFLSISSCYRGFYSLSKNWLRQIKGELSDIKLDADAINPAGKKSPAVRANVHLFKKTLTKAFIAVSYTHLTL